MASAAGVGGGSGGGQLRRLGSSPRMASAEMTTMGLTMTTASAATNIQEEGGGSYLSGPLDSRAVVRGEPAALAP